MRTDYVDLYQLHSPPADAIESDEVLRFLEDSTSDDKVRYCAASVNSIAEAQLCLKHPIYAALQIAFSLAEQEPATEVFPLARSRGVGIIINNAAGSRPANEQLPRYDRICTRPIQPCASGPAKASAGFSCF